MLNIPKAFRPKTFWILSFSLKTFWIFQNVFQNERKSALNIYKVPAPFSQRHPHASHLTESALLYQVSPLLIVPPIWIADFSLKVGPLLNGWLCYAHGRQKYRMHGYLILSHPSFLLPWLCHKGITKLKEKWDKFLLNFFDSQSIWFSVDLAENYLKKWLNKNAQIIWLFFHKMVTLRHDFRRFRA